MEQTAFFVIGIALVLIALTVSVIGLRYERFPGSRLVLAAGATVLIVFVAGTTTAAVINAREEQKEHNEEAAAEEQKTETEAEEAGESPKEPTSRAPRRVGPPGRRASTCPPPRTGPSRSTPTSSTPRPAR